jgi:hypothetical protein
MFTLPRLAAIIKTKNRIKLRFLTLLKIKAICGKLA